MGLNTITIRRIASDVKYIIDNSNILKNENIYYKHDEENILKGYAMIIGSEDTPYYCGFYFFEFNFPENYPFEPPKVTYLTNDGKTRFNPNFYINGKVCLSVLNTWSGDNWTSCQTINSILLILASRFNKNPLLNEPGITKNNVNIKEYNSLLSYKNIEFAILEQYNIIKKIENNSDYFKNSNSKINSYYNVIYLFKDIFIEIFKNNYEIIKNSCATLNKNLKKSNINVSTYNLKFQLDYYKLIDDLNKIDLM